MTFAKNIRPYAHPEHAVAEKDGSPGIPRAESSLTVILESITARRLWGNALPAILLQAILLPTNVPPANALPTTALPISTLQANIAYKCVASKCIAGTYGIRRSVTDTGHRRRQI